VKRSHPNRIGNDDGFNPDSCQDVLVEGCHFDVTRSGGTTSRGLGSLRAPRSRWSGPSPPRVTEFILKTSGAQGLFRGTSSRRAAVNAGRGFALTVARPGF
jgi:hypothetical protein